MYVWHTSQTEISNGTWRDNSNDIRKVITIPSVNTMKPTQDGRHFADNIIERIFFVNELKFNEVC